VDVVSDAGPADDETTADAGNGPACDAASAPSDNPCVIAEAYGVFVSPAGTDGKVGTRAAPVFSIGHGMDLAKAAGKRVYVCAGAFGESLVVDPSRDGVNVYGGFDCGTWTYSATNRVTVGPSQPGYALEVEGLAHGAVFEDLEFDAPRASLANPGQSSIAVLVSGSQGVSFERVVMVAGNGTDGAPGASGQDHGDGGAGNGASNWFGTAPAYAELNGNDATSSSAGSQNVCACGDATSSTGGQGGAGPGDGGQVPGPGLPSYGSDAGAGTPGRNGAACGAGGSPVLSGGDGLTIAAALIGDLPGTVSGSGWAPANGAAGADGQPGQGGGGGGDGPAGVGGGGGGACGGCGGAGGKAGAGGGSSIALLSYQSVVALESCTLTTNNAGNGGAGGYGEAGQPGSFIDGNGSVGGCPGGGGGSGSGGNGGQGGPGGLSLGIGYAGTAPTFDGSPVSPAQTPARILMGRAGAAGTSGLGGPAAATGVGQPQPGADGPAGLAGVAQAVLSF
jgi:hypothetical protein